MKTFAVFALAAALIQAADWKVVADKRPSPVSQRRNVRIDRRAKNEATAWLALYCRDNERLFRIVRNYSLANGIDSALSKSQLERTLQKGEQYERYGFAWHAAGSKRMVKVRWRFASEEKATERDYPAGYSGGVHFAAADDDLSAWLPKLLSNERLYVEIPERTGKTKALEFDLKGLATALAKAKQSGCDMKR